MIDQVYPNSREFAKKKVTGDVFMLLYVSLSQVYIPIFDCRGIERIRFLRE
jgi:hypothetical protein